MATSDLLPGEPVEVRLLRFIPAPDARAEDPVESEEVWLPGRVIAATILGVAVELQTGWRICEPRDVRRAAANDRWGPG